MNATQLPNFVLPLPAAKDSGRGPKLARLSDVAPREVEWLFPARVAVGKVTVLVGEAGIGKGELAADLVARVTRESIWPEVSGELSAPSPCPLPRGEGFVKAGSAIVVCPDDVREEIMSARLAAAGADLEKVFVVDADRSPEMMEAVTVKCELNLIKAAIQSLPDCKLVVINPLSMLLEGLDRRTPGVMEDLLRGLATLAKEHRVAIVVAADLNGRASLRSVDRLLATFGNASRSRSVWGIFRESAESDRRVMVSLDRNFGDEAEELSFRLVNKTSGGTGKRSLPVEGEKAVAREGSVAVQHWQTALASGTQGLASGTQFCGTQAVEWGEAVKTSVEKLLVRRAGFRISEQEYRDQEKYVATRLREELSGGPVKQRELVWRLPSCESQRYRAAEQLGVAKHKDGFQGEWVWMLPEHEADWLARDRQRKERRTARAQENAAKKEQSRSTPTREPVLPSHAAPAEKSAASKVDMVQNSSTPVEKWSGSFSPPVEAVNCFIGGDSRSRTSNEKQSSRAGRHEARLRDAAG
jgi:hypothetical protein